MKLKCIEGNHNFDENGKCKDCGKTIPKECNTTYDD